MLIAGVLCVSAAVVMAVLGLRSLVRPVGTGTVGVIMRSVAPPQLAGAIMLAAGGAVALAAPVATALPVICVCVVGALGTVAAGSYHSILFVGYTDDPAIDGAEMFARFGLPGTIV